MFLSELSTITHLSWVALQGMAHSFIELDKAVVHVISLVSFLWLWFSFKVLFMPSKSLFPQSCVNSGGSMVGLMATSSKGLMPYPGLLDPELLSQLQATADPYLLRRHSNSSGSVSQGLWVLVHTRFIWTLWASLVGKGFDSKCDFTPPTILLGLLLCSWTWGIFFFFFLVGSSVLQSMIV